MRKSCGMSAANLLNQAPDDRRSVEERKGSQNLGREYGPFTVDAARDWNDTDLALETDRCYEFKVLPGTWSDGNIECDAAGYSRWWHRPFIPRKRHSKAKTLALIGSIDQDENCSFVIGNHLIGFSPKNKGKLSFYANNTIAGSASNSGKIEVT